MRSFLSSESLLMKFMNWLADMVHLQFLWIIFSLVGLIIGGVFPASYALFSCHRQIILEKSISKNNFFWKEYKKNFIKANLLGYSSIFLVVSSLIHLRFSVNIQNSFVYYSILISLALLVLSTLLHQYIWTVSSHYDLGIIDTYKHALIFEFSYPIHTLLLILLTIAFLWSVKKWPVLLPFFSVAAYTYLFSKVSMNAFNKAEEKLHQSKD